MSTFLSFNALSLIHWEAQIILGECHWPFLYKYGVWTCKKIVLEPVSINFATKRSYSCCRFYYIDSSNVRYWHPCRNNQLLSANVTDLFYGYKLIIYSELNLHPKRYGNFFFIIVLMVPFYVLGSFVNELDEIVGEIVGPFFTVL